MIADTPPMDWSMGCDSFVMAILTAAAPLGIAVSYPMLKGLSATAFRLMFAPNWQRYAPDALQGSDPSRLAYSALGLHAETIELDPASADSRLNMQSVIRERIDAGYPLLGLQLIGWEDWGVIAGYAEDGETLLCRSLHVPGEALTPARRWPWMIQAIGSAGPAPARKGSIMRSLRSALEMYETASYGSYASGQAAYKLWIDGLHEEDFYAPFEGGTPATYASQVASLKAADAANLEADRPLTCAYLERAHVNHWRLKSLCDARHAASKYLEEAALLFGGEAGVRLAAAGRDYEEVTSLLNMARPFAPSEHQLESMPWSQRFRDKQAGLLQEALAVEDTAVYAIRAALARMSMK
jgi:hypothetical protein